MLKKKKSWQWCLRRQSQVDLYELDASLAYPVSSRIAQFYIKKLCLKEEKNNPIL